MIQSRFSIPAIVLVFISLSSRTIGKPLSHPPLRKNPSPSTRPLSKGPAFFVSSTGNDKNPGTKDAPFKTIGHAVKQLKAGDTLYLRGGRYFENVRISLAGKKNSPITIRSYPGEQASIDGGLSEFQEQPDKAWTPYAQGGTHEYRSTKRYPNIRDVVGAFGDSDIGLQTYSHLIDLRSNSGLTERKPGEDLAPLYCGPGIHYDKETGYVHVRLAHTNLKNFTNYKGETDPRKLPLVIAPFRSVPLHIDHANHVHLQDLILRGGGYETCVVDYGVDVEFDNVTIRGGTYCMRTSNTGPFRFHRSAMYGNAPPWSFRGDGSLRARPGRNTRDIARLTCHALWVTDTGREHSVYAFPMNDNWEISYSEFTDSHDGLYLGGISVRFHHNVVENFQDDGIYLSQMYPRHLFMGNGARIEIYQNYFGGALTPLAFGGMEDTRDDIYVFRNVFDLRAGVNYGRPSTKNPDVTPYSTGRVMADHGGPPWPKMTLYHNTFVLARGSRTADFSTLNAAHPDRPRRLFNNVFVNFAGLSGLRPPTPDRGQCDGNLYWSPMNGKQVAETFFKRYQGSKAHQESKSVYSPGFTTNSMIADPRFLKLMADAKVTNDYRLMKNSPAINVGVSIPKEWPDPLRDKDAGKPDIGAIPLGGTFAAGRSAAKK